MPSVRSRQALNFSFAMSIPRGSVVKGSVVKGSVVVGVLLMVAAPGQPCQCRLSSRESGHQILSDLVGVRKVEAPGA